MGFLIIAMVVSAMITRAFEESKRQSAARWQEAQRAAHERRAAADKRRQAAAAARRRRIGAARKAGPSDPLWWLWAAGWMTAATVRGSLAAVDGARQGAQTGVREGYRIGQERAWARQARQRREQAAYRNGTAAGKDAGRAQAEREHPEWRPDPAEEVAVDPCPHCGTYSANPAACPCRRPAPSGPAVAAAGESTGAEDGEVIDAEVIGETAPASAAVDDAEVIDAEIVEDPNETTPSTPITTEGNTEMAQLTSGISGGDGEGYATTVTALNEIKSLLDQVNQVVTDLGDTLASNNVDQATTGLVSELDDHLQAAVSVAEQAATHAEGKHGEVAHAIAGAGGSGEIADATWYDTV